jgi:hypothetical protein
MIESVVWPHSVDGTPFRPFRTGRPLRVTLCINEAELVEGDADCLAALRELGHLEDVDLLEVPPRTDMVGWPAGHEPERVEIVQSVDDGYQTLGVFGCTGWPQLAANLAGVASPEHPAAKAMLAVLPAREAHRQHGRDFLVTNTSEVSRVAQSDARLNVRTLGAALKIVGLFLRSRGNFVVFRWPGAPAVREAIDRHTYASLCRSQMPGWWRYTPRPAVNSGPGMVERSGKRLL